jgi:LCP family protein required for cell wall assembly
MVSIAGAVGTQKINATYAYGGASEAVYEMSKFCGVPISHYAEVDFEGLERVVDLLGGVWVDVPEAVSLSQTGHGSLAAGPQMLDGETALAYARERYNASGGDFGRAQAQRLIVQAIIRQTMQAGPAQLPGLINNLAACITTDYTVRPRLAGHAVPGPEDHHLLGCVPQLCALARWRELRGHHVRRVARHDEARGCGP